MKKISNRTDWYGCTAYSSPNPAVGDCYPSVPQAQEEGGCPCYAGKYGTFSGNADPYTLTDVDIMNEPEVPAPDVSEPEMVSPVEQRGNHHANRRGNGDSPQKEPKEKFLKRKGPRRRLLKGRTEKGDGKAERED